MKRVKKEGIEYAHAREEKKVHVTMNVFPHNEDLEGIGRLFKEELYEIGADAIIVADPGIIMTAREVVPNLEIHLSTPSKQCKL